MDSVRRALLAEVKKKNFSWDDPFSIFEGSYYELLNKNRLILKESQLRIDTLNPDRDSNRFHKKIVYVSKILKLMKRILGLERYLMAMKFLNLYSRDEYQLFLIEGLEPMSGD
ncbi:MAG: hypothetical protein IPN59_09350 [Holophaga sp.]|nr:hypothetical protein [Holophaga sp.]